MEGQSVAAHLPGKDLNRNCSFKPDSVLAVESSHASAVSQRANLSLEEQSRSCRGIFKDTVNQPKPDLYSFTPGKQQLACGHLEGLYHKSRYYNNNYYYDTNINIYYYDVNNNYYTTYTVGMNNNNYIGSSLMIVNLDFSYSSKPLL